MITAKEQILAAFVVDNGKTAERFLKKVQAIDKADENVVIIDAAIAEKNRFGRVKIHQTTDRGGVRGGIRGGTIGVVVGTILLGPAGAVVGGAAGGILAGLHNRFHDIGVNDKFMRDVGKHIDRGMCVLFVQYEGNWSHSIGAVEDCDQGRRCTVALQRPFAREGRRTPGAHRNRRRGTGWSRGHR